MVARMTDVAYRVLGKHDVPLLRELLAVFADAVEDSRTYLESQPDDAYLSRFLAQPHVIAIVADLDADRRSDQGRIVGGLVAYELQKFEQARSEIYIYDLAVALPYRRQGIARGLIARLQVIGGDRGAYVIFVQADPGDDPALALYNSLGVREDVHHFDIPTNARGH